MTKLARKSSKSRRSCLEQSTCDASRYSTHILTHCTIAVGTVTSGRQGRKETRGCWTALEQHSITTLQTMSSGRKRLRWTTRATLDTIYQSAMCDQRSTLASMRLPSLPTHVQLRALVFDNCPFPPCEEYCIANLCTNTYNTFWGISLITTRIFQRLPGFCEQPYLTVYRSLPKKGNAVPTKQMQCLARLFSSAQNILFRYVCLSS